MLKSEVKKMSPRTGRPKLEDPNVIRTSVNLNRDLMERLDEFSKKNGITKGEAIRLAIRKLVDENKK